MHNTQLMHLSQQVPHSKHKNNGLCYIKKYKGDLKHNCEIHEYNTNSKYDLHTQCRNISLLQNSVLHMGVRLYKRLPLKIKKT
jgi:hypothetical protein